MPGSRGGPTVDASGRMRAIAVDWNASARVDEHGNARALPPEFLNRFDGFERVSLGEDVTATDSSARTPFAVDDRAGCASWDWDSRRIHLPSEAVGVARAGSRPSHYGARPLKRTPPAPRPDAREDRDDGLDVHLDDHRARLAEVTRGGGVALGDAHVALPERRRRRRPGVVPSRVPPRVRSDAARPARKNEM